MKKYIKWIFLALLIVSIIITIILFIDFKNSKVTVQDTDFDKIQNKEWYRTGNKFYLDNELKQDSTGMADNIYMVFDEDFVSYCEHLNEEAQCKKYNYSHVEENNTIFIDAEDYFVPKGTYKITYYEDSFDLTLSEDNYIIIYHFETAKG